MCFLIWLLIDSRGQNLFQGKYDVKNEYNECNKVMRSSLVTCLDQLFLRKIHSLDPNYQWLLISFYQIKTCLDLAWIWTCSYKGVWLPLLKSQAYGSIDASLSNTIAHNGRFNVCFTRQSVSISPSMIVVSLACACVACVAQNHRYVRFESVSSVLFLLV